jgi:hypothetical protein
MIPTPLITYTPTVKFVKSFTYNLSFLPMLYFYHIL